VLDDLISSTPSKSEIAAILFLPQWD